MKRFLHSLVLLLLSSHLIFAQLELLTELNFPERAVLTESEFERFRYAVDGDWHIVSSLISGQRQGLAYNAVTGEVKNTNYIIETPWEFETERIYPGWDVATPNTGWVYLKWFGDGVFVPRSPLPAFPRIIYEDIAYGLQIDKVYEMAPFGEGSKVLFEMPADIATNHLEFERVDQFLYIAHRKGVLVYDLELDSLYAPFDEYVTANGLEYVPWTCHNGRFLFRPNAPEHSFQVHELGHGMEPRIIPQGNNPPAFNPPLWYLNNGFRVSRSHREKGVVNSDAMTWLGYMSTGTNGPWTNHLIRIDRSMDSPGVDEVAVYEGNVRLNYATTPVIYSMEDGKLLALGMYGEEGIEPYGVNDAEAYLLKDFYEGPRASVGYAYSEDLNMIGRFQRVAEHNGRLFFPVNATYFGMEIAVTDGTPQGTRLLADLEPGLKGIRAVEFFPEGDHLHFLVQRDDFRMAIYKLGDVLPEAPTIPEPDPAVDWELLLANEDGVQNRLFWHNPDMETPIVYDGNLLTYLTDRLDPPMQTYEADDPRLLLMQIDANTGEVLNEKLFQGAWLEHNTSARLLPRPDGGFTLIQHGWPRYADELNDIEWPFISGIYDAIFMVSFDSDLNFIDIKRLLGVDPSMRYELIAGVHATDEGYVLLAEESNRDYHLMRFGHDGQIINQVSIPRLKKSWEQLEMHIEEASGNIQVVNYQSVANCSDCELRIYRYNEALAFQELWTASFDGMLVHPRLHDIANGERWLVGALDGAITLPGRGEVHHIAAEGLGKLKIFAAKRIEALNWNISLRTYEVEALKYYPSYVREGNVFLHYLRPDIGAESFQKVNYINDYFNIPDRVYYEIAQLDSRAEMVAFNELEMEIFNIDEGTYPTSFIAPDGKWIRGLRTGGYNVAHVDLWKHPRPTYHANFANRFQLFQTNWPFTSLPVELVPTDANEEGSHMGIFPNPNNGSFILMPRDGANQVPYDRFHIHDMQGRLVYERSMEQSFAYKEIQLPPSLAEGVYHVVFSGQEAQESLRLVLVK